MQTLNLDEDIYFLLVLGMVAVGAHAYTLFNQRIAGTSSSQRWKFLDNIPIQLVTKKSSFNYGFFIYLALFELIYLILASSSSLVLMMYQISGREELTGALSESVKPNGAVPILASTAIILLSQVRPFSSFELALRSMTHRYARIPENMKAVKQNIMRSLQEKPLRFPCGYDADCLGSENGTMSNGKVSLLTQNVEKWIYDEFSDEDSTSFAHSYWNMLCLNEYTLESMGSSLWDADESEEILKFFRSTEHEVAQLRTAVETAALKSSNENEEVPRDDIESSTNEKTTETDSKPENDDESKGTKPVTQLSVAQWKTQRKKCTELEERLALLLSLLIINQPDVQATDDQQLSTLISTAQSQQKSDIANYTFNSTLVGGICVLFFFTLYFLGESTLKGKIRQDPFSVKAPYGEYIEQQLQTASSNAEVYRWSGLHLVERRFIAEDKTRLFLQQSTNLNKAIDETILILLLFASSISVALASRGHYIRLREWNVTVTENKLFYPVSKYYMTCTYAMICSLAVLFAYYFLTLALFQALKDNKDVLDLDVINPFLSFMPSLLSTSAIAWVCAYFALFASDVLLSDKKNLHASSDIETDVKQIDLSSKTVATVTLFQSVKTSLFFGMVCAVVAVTGKLYLNNLISFWDASSTFFLNFIGFSTLFFFFFRSVSKFGMHTEKEQNQQKNQNTANAPVTDNTNSPEPSPGYKSDNSRTENRSGTETANSESQYTATAS